MSVDKSRHLNKIDIEKFTVCLLDFNTILFTHLD